MYIPEIGDVILLEEDWNINIIPEHRNISILKNLVIILQMIDI